MGEIVINEIYGPVLQGEGATRGRPAAFVRLGRCNLACKWCDTPYTWDWKGANGQAYTPAKELKRMSVEDVVEIVQGIRADRVIISGGEPMLQQKALAEFILCLPTHSFEIETAGTRMPTPLFLGTRATVIGRKISYNVSPKLENSGNKKLTRYKPAVLKALRDRGARFKFVVNDKVDLEEVDEIVKEIAIERSRIWIMPEGVHVEEVIARARLIEPAVLDRGWNLTLRDHVLLHGDRRGV